jgi:hypothetical protein
MSTMIEAMSPRTTTAARYVRASINAHKRPRITVPAFVRIVPGRVVPMLSSTAGLAGLRR